MSEGGQVRSQALPPPVNGVNLKGSIARMDTSYCLDARNFISHGQKVEVRGGTDLHAWDISVLSTWLLEYKLQNGTAKLLAIGGNRLYDITAGGGSPVDLSNAGANLTYGPTPSAVVFRDRFFIKDQSGLTDVWYWDGAAASIAAAGFTGPGGDDKLLAGISSYKNRLYFLGLDASVWYGGLDAVTGALTQFDVQSLLSLGGNLLYAGPANKLGDTNQQYFAFISVQGEVLLYQGEYPGSVTWSLVGQYFMPKPISYSSFLFWGPNLVIITYQGLILLSEVLSGKSQLTFLSENINERFVDLAASQNSYVHGVFYPSGNIILVSLYDSDRSNTVHWAMSTINYSWWSWEFKSFGDFIYRFAIWDNQLVYATKGKVSGSSSGQVYIADTGEFDTDPEDSALVADRPVLLQQAYTYLDDYENNKTFLQVRPIAKMNNGADILIGLNVDFSNETIPSTVRYTDTSDLTLKVYRPFVPAVKSGKAASVRIEDLADNGSFELYATEIYYEVGGPFA